MLVAQALGLNLETLVDIYRIYFPVLQQNEAGTWYDQQGRIVWTCSKGLPGVGYLEKGKSPGRKAWEQMLESGGLERRELASGAQDLVCKAKVDFLPSGAQEVERRFVGPFTTCDRVADYRRAWAYFAAHRENKAADAAQASHEATGATGAKDSTRQAAEVRA